MKKVMALFAILVLTSCDSIFAPITFKVIGNGNFNVWLSEDGTQSSSVMSATTFKVNSGGVIILSAQSNSGTGVKIEAYLGSEKIKSASAGGYGVASITVEN